VRNGRQILPWTQLPCNRKGSLTFQKSATRDPRLYFPSEGRHAEDFYARKNPTASAGFEPEASMLNTRPPKPLAYGGSSSNGTVFAVCLLINFYLKYILTYLVNQTNHDLTKLNGTVTPLPNMQSAV
jgi:hypothetical protein